MFVHQETNGRRTGDMKRKCSIITVTAIVLFLSVSGVRASPSSMAALEKTVDKIVSILKTPDYSEKETQTKEDAVYDIATVSFDFRTLSMLALGRNWRRFSEDQKDRFSKYFSRLITQVYLSKIQGQDLGSIEIEYRKTEQIAPDAKMERSDVYTAILHDGVKTPVVYRMLKESGEWKIYDVKIEGVSLAGNYREQYRKRFMDSPEKIINDLKEKVEN